MIALTMFRIFRVNFQIIGALICIGAGWYLHSLLDDRQYKSAYADVIKNYKEQEIYNQKSAQKTNKDLLQYDKRTDKALNNAKTEVKSNNAYMCLIPYNGVQFIHKAVAAANKIIAS